MPLYLYLFLPRHTLPTYHHFFFHPSIAHCRNNIAPAFSPKSPPHIRCRNSILTNLDSEMAESLLMSLDGAETELRLGLPGAGEKVHANYGKRGFEETVDLKLNLSSSDVASDRSDFEENRADIGAKPPAKAQVVGWPPVRSFRKNAAAVQKRTDAEESEKGSGAAAAFVKVSMDGAPYLRKVDLKMYKTYQELSDALGKMFGSFTIGKCETNTQGMLDFMNESKLMDLLNSSEYVPTYEDKDGDWMLVGDVPWEMFVGSCKRLCIMKGTEAKGLAPRAMEKCKRRT